MPRIFSLYRPDEEALLHVAAAQTLGRLGPAALPAVPLLVLMLGQSRGVGDGW